MDDQSAGKRFADLLVPQLAEVLRVAQILCGGDSNEAEDLTQETVFKALRAFEQFKPETDLRAWLLTILRNTRIDRIRSGAGWAGTISLDALTEQPVARRSSDNLDSNAVAENPAIVLEQFSDPQMIHALAALPEEIRWTLLLLDVEQMDQEQAAGILDVPIGTIKSRAHRGRAMLKEALMPFARQQGMLTK